MAAACALIATLLVAKAIAGHTGIAGGLFSFHPKKVPQFLRTAVLSVFP
jgi:hypothetical protein